MIEQITTRNSVYEIDLDGNRVRRVVGVNAPTPRQGDNADEWREVAAIKFVDYMGEQSLLIMWDEQGRSTITSKVLSREQVST